MASNALIWNPLTKKDDRLLVYYNSSKANLGLRQWTTGEDPTWGSVFAEKEESAKGNIKVGTGLTALRLRDWIRVYGIVSAKNATTGIDDDYISLLSPVIQSLSIKTDYGRLTGSGNGKDKGWLYFLVSDPPVIHERDLDNSNSVPIAKGSTLLKQETPPALTGLASTYAQKAGKRWAFYQASDKVLHGLEVQGSNDRKITSNARPGSPLAATSFVHKEVEVLVLYWIRDADGVLTRSHSTNGGQNWQEKDLEVIPSLETLSAASNATFEQIAVVFSANDTNEPQIIKDEWESILNA
ncbi:hypothetical protein TGAM01_v206830 [Trichoderma gamsii]|uniref:Fucose-specific lectin n=1 Tax=Trichoderma gamsii TaxID=398673 RepID=A0A2P4ZIN3_9HYPO|nr:hypothetical protein TGAM01_v206830 [Trichoderma gamsii]PON24142.1 hypothetical protein TGAM01_v206830 [Trichoderma gamsii]